MTAPALQYTDVHLKIISLQQTHITLLSRENKIDFHYFKMAKN